MANLADTPWKCCGSVVEVSLIKCESKIGIQAVFKNDN
jgi:hypothetical protein